MRPTKLSGLDLKLAPPPLTFPSKCSVLVIYTLLCLIFVHGLIDVFVYLLSAYYASGLVSGGKTISDCFLRSLPVNISLIL